MAQEQVIFEFTQKGLDKVISEVNKLDSSIGKAEKASGNLEKTSPFKSFLGAGLVVNALSNVTSSVVNGAKEVFTYAGTVEQMKVAWDSIAKSDAPAIMEKVNSVASKTPYSIKEIDGAFKTLYNSGYKDIGQLEKVFTTLGDTASGVGAPVDQVTRAFSQMSAKGKVTGEEMLQLSEAGVPAWKLLADAMGLSVAQVQDMSSKGKLGSDSLNLLLGSMEKTFGGGMQKQAETFNGKMSTLKDNVLNSLEPAFTALQNVLKSFIDLAINFFDNFNVNTFASSFSGLVSIIKSVYSAFIGTFSNFIPEIQRNFDGVTSVITNAFSSDSFGFATETIKELASLIGRVFGESISIASSLIKGFAELMISAFNSDVAKTMINSLKVALDAFNLTLETLRPQIEMFKFLVDGLSSVASNQTAVNVITALAVAIGLYQVALVSVDLWQKAVATSTAIMNAVMLANPIAFVIIGIIAVIVLAITYWDQIKSTVMMFVNVSVTQLTILWQNVQNIFNQVLLFVLSVFSNINTFISTVFTSIQMTVTVVFGAIVAFIQTQVNYIIVLFNLLKSTFDFIVNSLVSVVQTVFNAIVQTIQTQIYLAVVIFEFLKNTVSAIFNAIVLTVQVSIGIVNAIFNELRNFVGIVFNAVGSVVSTVFNAIQQVISSAMNNVRNVVSNIINSIASNFNNVLSTVSNVFNTVRGIVSSVMSTISGVVSSSVSGIRSAFDSITGAVSGVFNGLANIARNAVSGIIGAFSGIGSKISGMFNGAVDGLKNAIPAPIRGALGFYGSTIKLPRFESDLHGSNYDYSQQIVNVHTQKMPTWNEAKRYAFGVAKEVSR